jgi:hypothetical protein
MIGIGSRVITTTVWVERILRILDDRLPIVILTSHGLLSPGKFDTCVLLDMKSKEPSVFPTLSVQRMLVSTTSFSGIFPYLGLLPHIYSGHLGLQVVKWHIIVKATL